MISDSIKMLLVENNTEDAQKLLKHLDNGISVKFETVHTTSIDNALTRLKEEEFELILLSLSTGDSVSALSLDKIKRAGPNIPVIVLLDQPDENFAKQILQMGVQDFLVKEQFNRDLIHRTLLYSIKLKRSRENLDKKEKELLTLGETQQKVQHDYYLLKAIFEETTDAIFIKDLQGRYLLINSVGSGNFGKTPEEMIGRTNKDFQIPDESKKTMDEADRTVLNTGKAISYEINPIFEGVKRTYITTKTPYRDQQGKIKGVIGISREITDRKLMEEKLRTEHAFRKPIEDSMLAGVAAVDLNARILYVNPSFCRMVGWKEEDLIGTSPPYVFWPPEEINNITKTLQDRLEGKGRTEIEYRFKRRNGELFQVVSLGSPLTDGHGKVIGYLSTFHDITDRKRIEEELKLQSEIIKNMAGGVMLIRTSDGAIVHTSPRLNQMFGYEPGELIGKHFSILIAPGTGFPEEIEKNIAESLKKTNIWSGELKNIKKDGSIIWTFGNISTLIHPLYGKVWVNIKNDITEKRKMEEELVKIQKLESLGLLAGGIAHDFNNILTGILGNISLAKTWTNPEDRVFQRLAEAEKASQRATELARQLLTFAKGGAPVKKTTAIPEILENSVKFALRGSNIISEFSFEKELWSVEIDEGQFSQVIQNLAINAQQAMPAGGQIRINAKNVTIGEARIEGLSLRTGNYVEISIQDQGVGIPKELLSKIFDPYFTTKEKGSGLGLAISHSIIQRHDGFISVKSKQKVGTTFSLFLPASPYTVGSQNEGSDELERGNGKVLIMDDEESVINVAGEMLRYLGYDVESALSGTIALEKYKRAKESVKSFDVVIADLTVPGDIGGIELLERLKKIDSQVRVIVSSGYSNDPAIANFKSHGFLDFITKPYRISDISKTVKKVMDS
jgi:PAS domain S-box-containing protein